MMMSKIISTKSVADIKGRKILFDTNVWIFIEGLNGQSSAHKHQLYTDAQSILRSNGNTIIVNEYILSEFCNRSIKLAYEFAKQADESGQEFMRFKEFRETEDFDAAAEVARDTCLNMLDECEFCSCHDKHYNIKDVLAEFASQKIDMSDIFIKNHCQKENYLLMTDDADYSSTGLDIITANKKLLAMT